MENTERANGADGESVAYVDPVDKFLLAAQEKHERGRIEHRLDPTAPFFGDVLDEYSQEQLDSKNYLDEMFRQGLIDDREYEYAFDYHFQAWLWIKNVRKR